MGYRHNWRFHQRAGQNGIELPIRRQSPNEILALLEQAADEQVISNDQSIETYDFNDEAVLEALKEADNDTSDSDFNFDESEEEELVLIDQGDDLSADMLGSKIQQAAAKLLISAFTTSVNDIHIEPHQDSYRIRVRRDGVMNHYVSMPRSAGLKLTACSKIWHADIAERRASQDGKSCVIEGQKLEFRCAQHPPNMAKRW